MKITYRRGLVALLPVIPAVAGVATVVLYLANWPVAHHNHHGVQLAIGFGVGVAIWLLSALGWRDLLQVETASARTYEDLRGRVRALQARLPDLAGVDRAQKPVGKEAVHEAGELVTGLAISLHIDGGNGDGRGSPYRWLRGNGYVNAWRDVHKAESALLAVEPPEVVYAAAVTNLDRLTGATATKPQTTVAKELKELLAGNGAGAAKSAGGATKKEGEESLATSFKALLALSESGLSEALTAKTVEERSSEEKAVTRCDQDWARALVRESAHQIHQVQNDAWDKIVNRRNRLIAGLALAVAFVYAVIALIVLQPVDRTHVLTGLVAFFLMGALLGVFRELYAMSQKDESTVFDYGLAHVRLMVTPVLSGVAALIGVVLTNYAGSLLVDGAAGTAQVSFPPLSDIFNLSLYPMGLVVAAIFGVTPGFVLDRLEARKTDYEKQIAALSPTSTGDAASTDQKTGAG